MDETRRPPGLIALLPLIAGGMAAERPPMLGRASDDRRSRRLEAWSADRNFDVSMMELSESSDEGG